MKLRHFDEPVGKSRPPESKFGEHLAIPKYISIEFRISSKHKAKLFLQLLAILPTISEDLYLNRNNEISKEGIPQHQLHEFMVRIFDCFDVFAGCGDLFLCQQEQAYYKIMELVVRKRIILVILISYLMRSKSQYSDFHLLCLFLW